MNLRKDHYRSFTRTVRTGSRLYGWLSPRARGRRRLEQAPFLLSSRGAEAASTPLRRIPRGDARASFALRGSVLPLERVRCTLRQHSRLRPERNHTTRSDGYLGMSNDEERSQMRYVVRIAEFSESSKL